MLGLVPQLDLHTLGLRDVELLTYGCRKKCKPEPKSSFLQMICPTTLKSIFGRFYLFKGAGVGRKFCSRKKPSPLSARILLMSMKTSNISALYFKYSIPGSARHARGRKFRKGNLAYRNSWWVGKKGIEMNDMHCMNEFKWMNWHARIETPELEWRKWNEELTGGVELKLRNWNEWMI